MPPRKWFSLDEMSLTYETWEGAGSDYPEYDCLLLHNCVCTLHSLLVVGVRCVAGGCTTFGEEDKEFVRYWTGVVEQGTDNTPVKLMGQL